MSEEVIWAKRGQLGDSFGTVNALFSALALAGVIYTLILQRTELGMQRKELQMTRSVMRSQLEEMKNARQLQTHPLVIPQVRYLYVHRPALDGGQEWSGLPVSAIYNARICLSNPTNHPAVTLILLAALSAADGDPGANAPSLEFIEWLRAGGESSPEVDVVLGADDGAMFENLRGTIPKPAPTLTVVTAYKNVVGGSFMVRQKYHLHVVDEEAAVLALWNAAILTFELQHGSEIKALTDEAGDWGAVHSDAAESLERKFEKLIDATPRELQILLTPIASSFRASAISGGDFERVLRGEPGSRESMLFDALLGDDGISEKVGLCSGSLA